MCAPGAGSSICPTATRGLKSEPQTDEPYLENVYFRNASPFSVELLHVDHTGEEVSHGFLSPGLRRGLPTLHGDVWRARALRVGQTGDRRLLLEHRIGVVKLKDCECQQPSFVDCKKPPFKGPRDQLINDPVVFENHANAPVDLYWWNGTCEELISWDEVGGVQQHARKPILSTQGHNFRVREAYSGRMLMQHTLNDLVIRSCEEDAEREAELFALQEQAWSLEAERGLLREKLAGELSKLIAQIGVQTASNASGVAYSVSVNGFATESSAISVPSLRVLLLTEK
ncbi:hypothetical protein AB1Y20_000051 [Prymnesium parvum]